MLPVPLCDQKIEPIHFASNSPGYVVVGTGEVAPLVIS